MCAFFIYSSFFHMETIHHRLDLKELIKGNENTNCALFFNISVYFKNGNCKSFSNYNTKLNSIIFNIIVSKEYNIHMSLRLLPFCTNRYTYYFTLLLLHSHNHCSEFTTATFTPANNPFILNVICSRSSSYRYVSLWMIRLHLLLVFFLLLLT